MGIGPGLVGGVVRIFKGNLMFSKCLERNKQLQVKIVEKLKSELVRIHQNFQKNIMSVYSADNSSEDSEGKDSSFEIPNESSEESEKEKNNLIKISIKELINYIANSIEILIEIKACEKFVQKMQIENSKNNYINTEDDSDKNGLKLYEGMLIKAERDIRGHIKVIN